MLANLDTYCTDLIDRGKWSSSEVMNDGSKMTFDPEDEEFFGSVGSFGVPKFDNEMRGVPRGFTMIAFTETGSGSELFAKQFTSPAEEPKTPSHRHR